MLFKYFVLSALVGGFKVDSPVKIQVARKLTRFAPPYTIVVGEEPSEGGWQTHPALTGLSMPCLDAAVAARKAVIKVTSD